VPGVQLDAAEVDDPRERGRVVDHRKDRRVATREADELLPYVVRVRRHALLVEEVARDAVRGALHVERAPPGVGERAGPHLEVVAAMLNIRQSALREEERVRVRDRDLVAAAAHLVVRYGP